MVQNWKKTRARIMTWLCFLLFVYSDVSPPVSAATVRPRTARGGCEVGVSGAEKL